MTDLWASLPREDCGIRRVNGTFWLLLFDALAVIALACLLWIFA